jgi:UDP-glucose 4-epimerase
MDKNILVTGGAGFIGSHVADILTERGYAVTVLDRSASPWLREDQRMIIGDMLDFDLLQKATRNQAYVFHFAGIADLGDCTRNPRLAVQVNVLGTINLLEACAANNVKRLIFASTAYVFSNKGGIYRSTKRACENLIQDYAARSGLEYVILRFGSLYGPRSPKTNGIRRMVTGILGHAEYTHHGGSDDVREYIYVRDAAEIAADCLAVPCKNSHYLLTGIEKHRIADIVEMIKEISGVDTHIQYSREGFEEHYRVTPYYADFKSSPKLVKNPYYDLGQGLLHLIEEIKAEPGLTNPLQLETENEKYCSDYGKRR